jgi:hypothetical protein
MEFENGADESLYRKIQGKSSTQKNKLRIEYKIGKRINKDMDRRILCVIYCQSMNQQKKNTK